MKDPVSRLKKDKELEDRWYWMWEAMTTFSRILEMKLRFEIGRKLLRSSVERDGSVDRDDLLRRGRTRACLNDNEKIHPGRLTSFVRIGPSSLKQSFKNKIGIESRDIVYFQKQKWVCTFHWQWLEYKIDHLWGRDRWKKKRIRRIR